MTPPPLSASLLSSQPPLSRRGLLRAGTALPLFGGLATAAPQRRPRVAAIYTICTHRSHAHVILENFLGPYLFNGTKSTSGATLSTAQALFVTAVTRRLPSSRFTSVMRDWKYGTASTSLVAASFDNTHAMTLGRFLSRAMSAENAARCAASVAAPAQLSEKTAGALHVV